MNPFRLTLKPYQVAAMRMQNGARVGGSAQNRVTNPVAPEMARLCAWWCQNKPVNPGPGEGQSKIECYQACLHRLLSFTTSSSPAPASPSRPRPRRGTVTSRAYRYTP